MSFEVVRHPLDPEVIMWFRATLTPSDICTLAYYLSLGGGIDGASGETADWSSFRNNSYNLSSEIKRITEGTEFHQCVVNNISSGADKAAKLSNLMKRV